MSTQFHAPAVLFPKQTAPPTGTVEQLAGWAPERRTGSFGEERQPGRVGIRTLFLVRPTCELVSTAVWCTEATAGRHHRR